MKASSISFKAACLFAIAGIGMGIGMAASGDHSVMPAHAHLNLLGWVSLFLFGIYYHLHPAIDTKRVALIQVGLWIIGTSALTISIAGLYLGYPAFEPIASVSSLVILAAIGIFAVVVFRSDALSRSPGPVLTAAE